MTAEEAPAWINRTFIEDSLHLGGEANLKVKELTLSAATAPGDNYGSMLWRAKVELEGGENRTLIVKMVPTNERRQFVEDAGLFLSERTMFGCVLPKIEALYNAAAPGRFPALTARCHRHGAAPVEFLVLEDLRPLRFQMADRHRGLGLRHCLLALRALARFHAASAALLQRDPGGLEGLSNPFKGGNPGIEGMITSGVEAAAAACRVWPGFEEYASCLEAFKGKIIDKYADLREGKPGAFNAILHGDFWTNNMMFRYEDGIPQEVRIVDLQTSNVASPTLDLLYFLTTSPTEEVSVHHEDLLIREYHMALSEAMEMLELKPPSLDQLLQDMDTYGSYALFGCLCAFPLIKPKIVLDVNALMSGDNSGTLSLYQDPEVKRRLQRLIPEYKRKGWLPS